MPKKIIDYKVVAKRSLVLLSILFGSSLLFVPGSSAQTTLPDLVPSILLSTGNPSYVSANTLFFRGRVSNSGTLTSAINTGRFRLDLNNNGSYDLTLTPNPSISTIIPGGIYTARSGDWVQNVPGTHKLEFCVDIASVVSEIDETNNCTTVLYTVPLPNLRSTITESANATLVGDSTYFQGNTTNSGGPLTEPFTTEFSLDIDANGTYDLDLSSLDQSSSPGYEESEAWEIAAGTYRLRMCADAPTSVIAESNETDNCDFFNFSIGPDLVDGSDLGNLNVRQEPETLAVRTYQFISFLFNTIVAKTVEATHEAFAHINSGEFIEGSVVTFKGEVGNIGQVDVNQEVDTYFAVDLLNDGTDDVVLESSPDPVFLEAKGASVTTISGSWIAVPGTHRLVYCVDSPNDAVIEIDEGNNCNAGEDGLASFTVIPGTGPLAPDLIAHNYFLQNLTGVATFGEGDSISISGEIKNVGTAGSPASLARICIDNPNCLDTTLGRVGSDESIPILAVADNKAVARVWVATPGSHTIYFCADVGKTVTEENETNNCLPYSFTVNPDTECADGIDNDGDGRDDEDDPGCFANPLDPSTYNPNDSTEGDEPGCMNGTNDDGDAHTDSADPGCHTDGNPNDGDNTYNPLDNDETDLPLCSNGGDDDGDGTADYSGGGGLPQDPGCGGDPNDNDETDTPCLSGASCSVSANSTCSETVHTGFVSCVGGVPVCDAPGSGVNQCLPPLITCTDPLGDCREFINAGDTCLISWSAPLSTSCTLSGPDISTPQNVPGVGTFITNQRNASAAYNISCNNGPSVSASKIFLCRVVPVIVED